MAPLENHSGPLETRIDAPNNSFYIPTIYGNDSERRPPSPAEDSRYEVPPRSFAGNAKTATKDLQLPKLSCGTAVTQWSDQFDASESQLRIRKLKRNKRRAEQGFSEARSQMDALQEENEMLRAENEELRSQQLEYAEMMKQASEVLRSIEEQQVAKQREEAKQTEHDNEKESALVTTKTALEMTLLNNKLTIEYLEDERQRTLIEMNESLRVMASQVEEIKQEKKALFAQTQAQDATIATLEEQNELKQVKIDILESMVRSLMDNQKNTTPSEQTGWKLPWSGSSSNEEDPKEDGVSCCHSEDDDGSRHTESQLSIEGQGHGEPIGDKQRASGDDEAEKAELIASTTNEHDDVASESSLLSAPPLDAADAKNEQSNGFLHDDEIANSDRAEEKSFCRDEPTQSSKEPDQSSKPSIQISQSTQRIEPTQSSAPEQTTGSECSTSSSTIEDDEGRQTDVSRDSSKSPSKSRRSILSPKSGRKMMSAAKLFFKKKPPVACEGIKSEGTLLFI